MHVHRLKYVIVTDLQMF